MIVDRVLGNGDAIKYLDFNTIDFGVHVDYFGEASHPGNTLVSEQA